MLNQHANDPRGGKNKKDGHSVTFHIKSASFFFKLWIQPGVSWIFVSTQANRLMIRISNEESIKKTYINTLYNSKIFNRKVLFLSSIQIVSENDYGQDRVAVRNTEKCFQDNKTMGSGLKGCGGWKSAPYCIYLRVKRSQAFTKGPVGQGAGHGGVQPWECCWRPGSSTKKMRGD